MFDAEREAMCNDLNSLEAGRWDVQSLCTEWKVRHVVAHLVAEVDRKVGAMLVDTVCHSADIRRPLGVTRALPEEALVAAADNMKGYNFPLGTKKRISGLCLTANGTAWSTGRGPVVEGPMESLVLVMAGRRAGLDDLTGEGMAALAVRMQASVR